MTDELDHPEPKLEETKRTARVLEIMHMVSAAPRRYQRKYLAQRYELSDRMLAKDIELIRGITGIHLKYTREGYYFTQVPDLPALHYSFAEALALLNAVRVAQQVSGIGSPELAAAVARMEALFPNELVALLRQASRPTVPTEHRQRRQQLLLTLNRALTERSKVNMIYATGSRDGALTERVVHPYDLIPYVRSWQLIAYCERRQDVRMFKIDRIQEAKILPATYQIPADFDVTRYMGGAWGVMRGDPTTAETVILRFTAEAGRWVAEEEWHPSQQTEHLEGDHVLFQVHISITPEFVNWVLYYGPKVEVLEPQHLRKTVADAHRQAAALYGEERDS